MVTTPCPAQNAPAMTLVSVSVKNIATVTVFGRMANAKNGYGLDSSDHNLWVSVGAIIILNIKSSKKCNEMKYNIVSCEKP